MDNLLNVEDTQPSKEDLDLLNNILGEEETSGNFLFCCESKSFLLRGCVKLRAKSSA